MVLRDFSKALAYLVEALGSDVSMCFNKIECSIFGGCFVFSSILGQPPYYRVWRGGLVEKIYSDPWRNPDHREIICEGTGEEVW